jgi:hypothetical protein
MCKSGFFIQLTGSLYHSTIHLLESPDLDHILTILRRRRTVLVRIGGLPHPGPAHLQMG